jgi:hypothetical protein
MDNHPNPTFNTVYRYALALWMRIALKVHRCPPSRRSTGLIRDDHSDHSVA